MSTVHVIGAGLSGLACALRLALAGRRVVVYEAARHAGGRCRSFMDEGLGCMIDNGSHMLMGANDATRSFLADIGSENALTEIAPAAFPFLDVNTGERWRLRPNGGLVPFWIWSFKRRVPGSAVSDYMGAIRLARAGSTETVADCVDPTSRLYDKLWQPLVRAVLNTDASEASARLTWAMLSRTFLKGEAACRPMYFGRGLSPTLIDPASSTLANMGAEIRFKARLRGLESHDGRVHSLYFSEGMMRLDPDDTVVLAVPPDICADLLPETKTPTEFRAIVNAHFKMDGAVDLPWNIPFLGLIGTESQWIFVRDNIVSITISAADRHVEQPSWQLANLLWSEVAQALGRNVGRLPPWRVIKEKRATIAQTPAQILRRPAATTKLRNLFLAGDWTATGLPATIEGSVRSGFTAAQCVLQEEAEAAHASRS